MRVTLYASFVALAASLAAASAVPVAKGPTDAQIKELTRTRLDAPFSPPNPRGKEDYGFVYPAGDKIQRAKQGGKCSFKVIMDVSRCAGMAHKQEAVAYSYDAYSMDLLHNNMKFETGFTSIGPYAQKTITINECGFNGKFMLMDQFSDNIFSTGRMSVRLVLEEGKASSWVTADPDSDETGFVQSRVAPLIRNYFASDSDEDKKRLIGDENHRGKKLSLKTTTNTTGNALLLQWC